MQNTNAGRSSPDHDIRPPFQDNYVEASTSSKPVEDTHINSFDLKNGYQAFQTQEDQHEHDFNQFQTKSGESFDFKQGYDTAVYEVHKQYKLRTRTIDIPEPRKPKDGKQTNNFKRKAVVTEPADIPTPNPHQVTVEDITEMQPLIDQPLPPSSSKENSNSVPKIPPKTEKPQAITSHSADKQEQITDTPVEKGKPASHNVKA